MEIERSDAEALDAADPLASFRDEFVIDDPSIIYVDGNSLGRLPEATASLMAAVIATEWGQRLVGGWAEWIDLAANIGDRLATHVLGASPAEVIVADSTSVNLYKLANAALDLKLGSICTDAANFPSDKYILQGVARSRGVEITDKIEDGCSLVSLSHVSYRDGSLADMATVTEAAHEAGALMLWDLSHSVGSVPVRLNECNVDLAVGCTYKYLNGGPGSPAFLYVRKDLQPSLMQPIWGWFGQRDQFQMADRYSPAEGMDRFLTGTPPILSMKAIEPGIDMVAKAGIDAIRRKSVAMTEMMVGLFDAWLAPLAMTLATPRTPTQRGSHLAFSHLNAYQICTALIEQQQVIPDFREPDIVRFGVAPLYTRYVDAWDAMDRLRDVLEKKTYLEFPESRGRIT